jgi:hypothetical protein
VRSVMTVQHQGLTARALMHLVPVREGLVAPAQISVDVDRGTCPFTVHLEVVIEGAKPVCFSVTYVRRPGGPPIASGETRRLRPERWAREALRLMLLRGSIGNQGAVAEPRSVILRRQDNTPSHRRSVADVYRAAVRDGDPPVRAVVSAFGVPRNTAKRWVKWCRDHGELKGTTPRRKGELGDLTPT